ncbi:MAG TPA: cyclophilin-like fold protein [Candidatus Methanofastidiosa archaeon]|nr:cyclophilin-like fold protein [Candidatus Methanofastidiosa archaeon]
MRNDIEIEIDGQTFEGYIYDDKSPDTAKMLLESLPIKGSPVSWGGEFYFKVPFHIGDENPTEDLEAGDIGFWPPGDVLCIFFGRTPISVDERPRPASAVNVIGKMVDHTPLLGITNPKKIIIRAKD